MSEKKRGWTLRSFCVRLGHLALAVSLPPATTEAELLSSVAELPLEVDVVEWRIDLFAPKPPLFCQPLSPQPLKKIVELARALRQTAGRPLLVTVRSRAEGGRWPDEDREGQAAILATLIKARAAELIDIEAVLPVAEELIAAAHEAGMDVVLSRHILGAMPTFAELKVLFLELRQQGADLPKLAARAASPEETLRLLAAAAASGAAPLIAIAMGEAGRLSRVAAAGVGGALGFAAHGVESAPGQLDVHTTSGLTAALAALFQPVDEGDWN
ncbi:MAG: type I 3-dehydroquinate dehydratase [Bacillota bacterium]|nr:type I 3-dehydroquinate dehydratase [Bacillota bacterium]